MELVSSSKLHAGNTARYALPLSQPKPRPRKRAQWKPLPISVITVQTHNPRAIEILQGKSHPTRQLRTLLRAIRKAHTDGTLCLDERFAGFSTYPPVPPVARKPLAEPIPQGNSRTDSHAQTGFVHAGDPLLTGERKAIAKAKRRATVSGLASQPDWTCDVEGMLAARAYEREQAKAKEERLDKLCANLSTLKNSKEDTLVQRLSLAVEIERLLIPSKDRVASVTENMHNTGSKRSKRTHKVAEPLYRLSATTAKLEEMEAATRNVTIPDTVVARATSGVGQDTVNTDWLACASHMSDGKFDQMLVKHSCLTRKQAEFKARELTRKNPDVQTSVLSRFQAQAWDLACRLVREHTT